MSIRTVRTDGYISLLTCTKGVSRAVDLYGSYGWYRPFSIRTRFKNAIWGYYRLSILGVLQIVNPYGPYKWNRLFSSRTRSEKIASHSWDLGYILLLT